MRVMKDCQDGIVRYEKSNGGTRIFNWVGGGGGKIVTSTKKVFISGSKTEKQK